MIMIIALILVGTLLVFLEAVLFGGIWGVGGAVCFAWAAFEAYALYGTLGAVATVAAAVVACIGAFLFWIYVIPKTRFGKKIYLQTSQDGRAPSQNLGGLAGREGVAISELVPTGKVEIDGNIYDAKSRIAHIESGARVCVVSSDAFSLVVRPVADVRDNPPDNDLNKQKTSENKEI